ncbi:hypothetical protein [Nonomuraea sp. NPDC050310]|uniref:hypothetical protein n=1 Tax=Nonomuraea sp. NPDC050310 TaxID=3154935 RepID=UPI0033CC4106
MAYVEKRGRRWRVRWRLADGTYSSGTTRNLETGEYFADEDEARQYGEDQETLIRLGILKDKEDGPLFEAWAHTWYSGLDLEHSTLETYWSLLQGHLMRRWAGVRLRKIEPHDVNAWEREMISFGYAPRTASDARNLLINILGEAIPRYLDGNPAVRKRGKGRKGARRVAKYQRAEKVWPSPEEVILIAERAALLAEHPDVFLMLITKAWTGMRWSEVLALSPDQLLPDGMWHVDTKLYQARKGFYTGYPKDGSLRKIDLPPFLLALLTRQAGKAQTCVCAGKRDPLPKAPGSERTEWCRAGGRSYLFLTPGRAHYQRGDFSSVAMRPAADGLYPSRNTEERSRPARPVLADVATYLAGPVAKRQHPEAVEGGCWPGYPVHWPWPKAEKGEEFVPPSGRGRPNWSAWEETQQPHLVSWLPIRPGLTPHGFRHGHQTWMDDGGIAPALKEERMGHENTSMQALYGHPTEGMRTKLVDLLEALWENGVRERFARWPSSPVPVLNEALAPWREGSASKIVKLISPTPRRVSRSA